MLQDNQSTDEGIAANKYYYPQKHMYHTDLQDNAQHILDYMHQHRWFLGTSLYKFDQYSHQTTTQKLDTSPHTTMLNYLQSMVLDTHQHTNYPLDKHMKYQDNTSHNIDYECYHMSYLGIFTHIFGSSFLRTLPR